MFDYVKFRWRLHWHERDDRETDRKYVAWLKKAKAQNAPKSEIETLEYERNMDGMNSADEVRKLHSRYYCLQAARMLIPLPDLMDKEMWEHESPNRICLTEKGVMHVRSIVRAERKVNLEIFLMWVPGVVGLIGAAIGLASILIRK
jgi:hypothetical protein